MHKKFQRIFTFVLALILALGFLSTVAMTVSAASVHSNTIPFSDFFKPTIEKQPQSVKTTDGRTVEITVVAKKKTDKDTLSYRWYYKDKGASSFTLDTGATGATYTATMTPATDGRQVYCVVVSKYGAKEQTATATMTMAEAVKITKQPVAVQAAKGESFSVSVKASGDGLSYCWYYKNKGDAEFKKSSVTTSVNSATMDAAWDGRQVYCVVKDRYGNTVRSNTVTVSAKAHKHSCAATYTTDSKGHWYKCADCGEKVSYAAHDFKNACDQDCSVCGYTRETDHTYSEKYKSDKTYHWKECTGCGLKTDKAEHTPGAAATETKAQTCKACGYVIAPAAGSTKPTQPTTEPTQPTTEPTQPTTEPTQPTTAPTVPTEKVEGGSYEEMLGIGEDQSGKELFWWICVAVVAVSGILLLVFAVRRKKDRDEW